MTFVGKRKHVYTISALQGRLASRTANSPFLFLHFPEENVSSWHSGSGWRHK